jgi:ferredoxin
MAEEKQYISRVKLTDGTTVELKDAEARLLLEMLFADTIILDCGTYLDDTTEINEE